MNISSSTLVVAVRGSMSGNKVHPTEEVCQTWEPRPQQEGLHANKQWSAAQETAQEFAELIDHSCWASHKTGLVWWFLHPFFSIIEPLLTFAVCATVRVLFLPSFPLFCFPPNVCASEGYIWGKQNKLSQTSSSLKPEVLYRSFNHCFSVFYFSFSSSAALTNKMTGKAHCSPVAFSIFELVAKTNLWKQKIMRKMQMR